MQKGYHQTISILLLFFAQLLIAQQSNVRVDEVAIIQGQVETALSSLDAPRGQFGYGISSSHQNANTGVTYIYVQQYFYDVEVYKSLATVAFNNVRQIITADRFEYDEERFVLEKVTGQKKDQSAFATSIGNFLRTFSSLF